MLSFVFALTGFAFTASSLSWSSVGSARPDIVTTTRFVFTCPCESTSSVSFGTSYPTSPASVTSYGHSGSSITPTVTPTSIDGTQSSISTPFPSGSSTVATTKGSNPSTSSISTTLSAGNSAPTTGQPFGIQVETSGKRLKRTLSSIGASNGELVLVESELEALAFMLSEEGALLIYETELAIGYSGDAGASPLMIYPSVVALPPLMAFSVADGALAMPAATFCTSTSNVLSVTNANSTDSSCAPVVATANTAPDSYNAAVANNVTASPLVSSNATTTSSTTISATSTSTTAQITPTALVECDPNTNDGCASGCEYCVVPTVYSEGNGKHSCNSLLYCHGCSYNSDCDQYGSGFTCGTYSTCSNNLEYLGNACAKAESAVCANNATLSSIISSSASQTGNATLTATTVPTAIATVTNGTSAITPTVTADPTAIATATNGTTANTTSIATQTSATTTNATATNSGATTTASSACNITGPLPDVTRSTNDTIATYRNFVWLCGEGLLEHNFVYNWAPPNYDGYNFTSAVGQCIQYALDQPDSMVAFHQSTNDNWFCVGSKPGYNNASAFVPFSGMQYAWGFEVVSTQAVQPTYNLTTTFTRPSTTPFTTHRLSTLTTPPTSTSTTQYISICTPDQYSTCPTSTSTSQPSSVPISRTRTTNTSQPTSTAPAAPTSTTGCNAQNLGDLTSSSGAVFQNFYSGCNSSIQGSAPGGYNALNFQTVMDFDAGDDGNHGGWTILTALPRCADNTVENNATMFEFYIDSVNNNWYCVSLNNEPASPSIFSYDPNTQDVWGYAIVTSNTTSTSTASAT